jgi:hypothetical protein
MLGHNAFSSVLQAGETLDRINSIARTGTGAARQVCGQPSETMQETKVALMAAHENSPRTPGRPGEWQLRIMNCEL